MQSTRRVDVERVACNMETQRTFWQDHLLTVCGLRWPEQRNLGKEEPRNRFYLVHETKTHKTETGSKAASLGSSVARHCVMFAR